MPRLYNKSALTEDALHLFDVLASSPELQGLTLIGGTALALQINHRISLDFDFASFEEKIPIRKIDPLVNQLKADGHRVNELTDTTAVSQFKINTGENLREYVRDYVINNIKVTFFAHGKNHEQRQYYNNAAKIQKTLMSFNILGIDGLKVAKTLVLADRARSRDLFDLMILVRDHSFSIEKLIEIVKQMGHIDDPEHYRAIMTGVIPLDKNDEGLKPVDAGIEIKEIYDFFDSMYTDHDIKKASEFYLRNTEVK